MNNWSTVSCNTIFQTPVYLHCVNVMAKLSKLQGEITSEGRKEDLVVALLPKEEKLGCYTTLSLHVHGLRQANDTQNPITQASTTPQSADSHYLLKSEPSEFSPKQRLHSRGNTGLIDSRNKKKKMHFTPERHTSQSLSISTPFFTDKTYIPSHTVFPPSVISSDLPQAI